MRLPEYLCTYDAQASPEHTPASGPAVWSIHYTHALLHAETCHTSFYKNTRNMSDSNSI